MQTLQQLKCAMYCYLFADFVVTVMALTFYALIFVRLRQIKGFLSGFCAKRGYYHFKVASWMDRMPSDGSSLSYMDKYISQCDEYMSYAGYLEIQIFMIAMAFGHCIFILFIPFLREHSVNNKWNLRNLSLLLAAHSFFVAQDLLTNLFRARFHQKTGPLILRLIGIFTYVTTSAAVVKACFLALHRPDDTPKMTEMTELETVVPVPSTSSATDERRPVTHPVYGRCLQIDKVSAFSKP